MIMAAGVGSRLMPMTADIPKPMIPMANQPLMANTVQLLQEHGFTSIIANLHYHADYISNYFGNGQAFGVSKNLWGLLVGLSAVSGSWMIHLLL